MVTRTTVAPCRALIPRPSAEPDSRHCSRRADGKDARDSILAKSGVRDRVQAVVFAYEHGLVKPRNPDQPYSDVHGQGRGRFYSQRNTLVFERLVGRTAAAPLLGVRQVVAIGEGESRSVVRARYDVLDDYTILTREHGAVSCVPSQKDRRPRPSGSETDVRGLLVLHVASSDGRLAVQE